jgi:hypothetical protein
MRGSLVLAVAVVCAALVLSGPTDAQQIKEITGTVDVGNLPLDAAGNVLVSGILLNPQPPPLPIRFVGFTQTQLTGDSGAIMLSRACHFEFPNTRQCTTAEIVETINPPLTDPATGWVRIGASPVVAVTSPKVVDPYSGLDAPGTSSDLVCQGFKSPVATGIIVDEAGHFSLHGCQHAQSVACCGPVLIGPGFPGEPAPPRIPRRPPSP